MKKRTWLNDFFFSSSYLKILEQMHNFWEHNVISQALAFDYSKYITTGHNLLITSTQ